MSFRFITYLTENEHDIVEDMIKSECVKRNFDFQYYRKFQDGHVPLYRECEINNSREDVVKMLDDLGIDFWRHRNG